jgi:hypothetical protein
MTGARGAGESGVTPQPLSSDFTLAFEHRLDENDVNAPM